MKQKLYHLMILINKVYSIAIIRLSFGSIAFGLISINLSTFLLYFALYVAKVFSRDPGLQLLHVRPAAIGRISLSKSIRVGSFTTAS